MNEYNFSVVVGLCGTLIGCIGIGYGIGKRKKLHDICDRLDKSLDDLSKGIEVDIPQVMIDKAVDKAVSREVEKQVKVSAREAVLKVSSDIERNVRESVNKSYSDIDRSVKAEIKKQIAFIDVREARKEVTKEAKDSALEKFDSDLNDILENYKEELDTVTKIYKTIANTINTDNRRKDNVINLIS